MVTNARYQQAILLAALLGAGCAPALEPAGSPVPLAAGVAEPVALPVADDSAADQAALEALAALEYGSLDRRADHLRGQLPAGASAYERATMASRGGAASVAGPSYDIDIESFAHHRRVQYYVDFFLGPARDRFAIWLGRMGRYEGMIREALRSRGVPEDLVYLALIESGFSNSAVSRSRAVGMWQFIGSTARKYGLRLDTWVDERRDPFRASDAAARHLWDLNEQFGSWYLAAAAYNAGAGRVSRSIRRLQGRSHSSTLSDTTFFALYDRHYLRRETRDYVPKLIAAALIAKHPDRYGFHHLGTLEPLVFDEVTVTETTSLDVMAELADTTARALAELNPQFYRGVTPPGQTVVVRVPRSTGRTVLARWADLSPGERVSFIDHRVRRGETLAIIGRRYGVSVRLVIAANPGVKPRRLRIGQRLVIPLSARARQDAAAGRAPAPPRATAPASRYHTVRRGESLWSISQLYGARISDLRRWNTLPTDEVLRVGRRLRVSRS